MAIPAVLTTTSSLSFFMITVSLRESAVAEDGVGVRPTGNAGVVNDDAEGEDGGEVPPDRPGEPSSSRRGILRRRAVVFVLMIANVEILSRSNPALRHLLIKPRSG